MTDQGAKSSGATTDRNDTPKGGEKDSKKHKDPKPKKPTTEKFKGATTELDGKVITGDTSSSPAQQFKDLHKQLKVYASAKFSADVGRSIFNMTALSLKDFRPNAPDPSLWTSYKINPDGTPIIGSDGEQETEVDEDERKIYDDMYKQQVKDCSRAHVQYVKDLRAMFEITLGQTDDSIQSALSSMEGYKRVEATYDTIALLVMLREVCYRDVKTSVHRHTSIIRAHRKLICSRQRDEDGATFVKNVTQRFEVLKAMKGSVLCEEVLEASLERQSPPLTFKQYAALSHDKRLEYDEIAEQEYLAAIIVEGSNSDTSNLRLTLAQHFALGSDRYPRNTTQATKMLNEFAGTTKKRSNNNTTTPKGSKPSNKQKQAAALVNKASASRNTTFETEGRQMLLAALESEDDFNNDGVCFVQAVIADDHSRSDESDWAYWDNQDDIEIDPADAAIAINMLSGASTATTIATTASLLDRSVEISTSEDVHGNKIVVSNTEDSVEAPIGLDIETTAPHEDNATVNEVGVDEQIHVRAFNAFTKPDPPGDRYDFRNNRSDKPNRRAHYGTASKPRSGTPEHRNGESTKRHTGESNLRALDLAVTPHQKESFGGTHVYRYPERVRHMFAQANLGGAGINPNWILLDSESSVHLIVNKHLLENIRIAPNGESMRVHCNAGTAVTRHVGDLKGFGTVWYYSKGIANILSLALISDQYRVTMDTDVDNAMYVHKTTGPAKRFYRGSYDLYYCDTRESDGTILAGVATVEGNKKSHSAIDCKRAERAAELQEIVGFPSDKDLLRMIDNKVLQNNKVTRRDVQLARTIFGKNRAIVQGKSVRVQVEHVREDITPVPSSILKTYQFVTLSCDIFHINGIRFFTTISRHIKFRTVRAISNARRSTLLESLKSIIGLYRTRGFTVKLVFADNQFECLRNDLLMLNDPVELNITAKDEHEPVIERGNRTVKERVRCGFCSTPFRRMPMRMIVELVYWSVFWLNSHIPEDGVSPTLSPREIMTGDVLDVKRHAKFKFGQYILAHEEETDNTMEPRATDAIYLRPCGNKQGGFYAFDINTGKRIHRIRGTANPMTQSVIDRVELLAELQKGPNGLIFGDANNQNTIHDLNLEENEDDDDASDASFNSRDDDFDNRSTHTELSGVTESSEVSGNINEEPIELPVEDNAGPVGAQDAERDDGDIEGNHDGNHVPNEVSDIEADEANEDELPTQGDDESSGADDDGSVTQDRDGDTPDDSEEPQEDAARESEGDHRRMQLRPQVQRGHNKYGESDGFNPVIHERRSMFTAGLSNGLSKLEKDEASYKGAAESINEYNNLDATQVTKQYGVRQGIKKFGEAGVEAVLQELRQFHDRTVVVPMNPDDMTKEMRERALPYLMFLKRKRCGKIKGRGCADGRRQREFISKEEASSPTVSLYALIISCLIDAIEGRDVATADIPGAFLQTDMPPDEEVYIRLDGTMAELLCKLDPKLYAPCLIGKGKTKILYARAKKAIYGTLRAALLFWENLSGKLTEWGFEANSYDACTMNKMFKGSQCTICWHVDDLKISHKDPSVVDEVLQMLNKEYGAISPLTVTRGKIHDYVGMTIDYSDAGKVKFSMFDYLEEIIQGLPEEFKGEAQTPAADHLFTVEEGCERLNDEKSDLFHHYVAKLLFMAKRTRPDIATAIAFLCTRVKSPDVHDWKKLIRVMKYLQLTPFIPLVLGWDESGNVYWHVDASFAVHKDMRSHTGGLMTLGTGAVISMSNKQKLNTKSSTEAELVGVDDIMNIQVWSRYFIDEQMKQAGSDLLRKKDVLFQDNTSAIKLEKNGKSSSTKRTRHIDIRYYFITDRIKSGAIDVEYCPTDKMVADVFTKPIQGAKFREHRNTVQGITETEYLEYKHKYLDRKLKRNNNNRVAITA